MEFAVLRTQARAWGDAIPRHCMTLEQISRVQNNLLPEAAVGNNLPFLKTLRIFQSIEKSRNLATF